MLGTKRLKVANIPIKTSRDSLKKLFEQIGDLEWTGPLKLETNGMSSITIMMSSYEEATRTLKKLHGQEVDGSAIDVKPVLEG